MTQSSPSTNHLFLIENCWKYEGSWIMTAQSKWQKSEQIKAWPNWLIRKLLVWDFHTRIWICNTGLLEGCGWAKESSTAPTCSAWVVSGVSAQEVEGKKLKLLGLRDPQHPTVSLRIWRIPPTSGSEPENLKDTPPPNIRQWAWESLAPEALGISVQSSEKFNTGLIEL